LEILIPDQYVSNISERLQLYSRLDSIKDERQLADFRDEVKDRFGPLPTPLEELISTVRLRWLGEKLGFEKLSLKNDKLRAFFISNNESYFNSDVFGHILSFVQKHARRCKMKDRAGTAILVTEGIKTVDTAIELLLQMSGQTIIKSANETLSR
ncbi:MAG: transcription-repair coupling factor, partial [Cyclobacteriaceae bacterium]|nr:transcription-repair coupling factor [Cyclobacteriaceae bacterium]